MFIFYLISLAVTTYFAFKIAEDIICIPPNVFTHIFAPPGTGKTTLAAHILRKAQNENIPVYSNVPLRGAYRFDPTHDLGKVDFRHCILIIDEGGSKLSNRNWHNNLSADAVEFIKKHRHYDVDIYIISQSYGDVDNKFRELTTRILFLKKSMIPFHIRAIAIRKTVDIINGQIVEFFEVVKGECFKYFTANCWAYFDSYDKMDGLKLKLVSRYTQADL